MEASIIVPTHNRALYLELTLESLFHQAYDKSQYEVIVIDDGSDDEVDSIINRFSYRDWNLHAIKQPNRGRSAARNAGIQASSGHIVIFVDADCICSRNLITKHLAQHNGVKKKAVIGLSREVFTRISVKKDLLADVLEELFSQMDPIVAKQAIKKIPAFLPVILDVVTVEDVVHNFNKIDALSVQRYNPENLMAIAEARYVCPWHFFITSNASVDRISVMQVGQFDENFQGWGEEDLELGYRLFHAGIEFDSALGAIVYHQVHPRDREGQERDWNQNFVKFAEKYKVPEIYLRWQVRRKILTMKEYEAIVQQIQEGLLSKTTEQLIKEQYEQFVENNL